MLFQNLMEKPAKAKDVLGVGKAMFERAERSTRLCEIKISDESGGLPLHSIEKASQAGVDLLHVSIGKQRGKKSADFAIVIAFETPDDYERICADKLGTRVALLKAVKMLGESGRLANFGTRGFLNT